MRPHGLTHGKHELRVHVRGTFMYLALSGPPSLGMPIASLKRSSLLTAPPTRFRSACASTPSARLAPRNAPTQPGTREWSPHFFEGAETDGTVKCRHAPQGEEEGGEGPADGRAETRGPGGVRLVRCRRVGRDRRARAPSGIQVARFVCGPGMPDMRDARECGASAC